MTLIQKTWRRLLALWVLMQHSSQAAASLAYTTLFALVPLLTVTYAILSLTPYFAGAGEAFQKLLLTHFVPSSGTAIQHYLQQFAQHARGLTGLGVIMLLVTSIMMFMTVEHAFNVIWKVKQQRKTHFRVLVCSLLVVALPLCIGVLFVTLSFVQSLSLGYFIAHVFQSQHTLPVLSIMLNVVLMTVIYMIVPNCKVPFTAAFKGSVLVAILFEMAKKLFAWFIVHSTFNTIYGAFAALPLFLFWLYLAWLIVLLGAECVHRLAKHASLR